MKRLVLLLVMLAAFPALAAQEPKPVDEKEPRVCIVPYRADRTTHIRAAVGDNITLQFGNNETMPKDGGALAVSDSLTLKHTVVGNLVMLKAAGEMPRQPITIRTIRADGAPHIYEIEWETGERGCYLIRWTYVAEEAEAKRAARANEWRTQQARAAEAALAVPQRNPVNSQYTFRGDGRLLQQVAKP